MARLLILRVDRTCLIAGRAAPPPRMVDPIDECGSEQDRTDDLDNRQKAQAAGCLKHRGSSGWRQTPLEEHPFRARFVFDRSCYR